MQKEDELLKKIGAKVKKLRREKNLTQNDMDEGRYNIPVRTIQKIEYGEVNVTISTLNRIAKRLGVRLKDLIDV